jgi:hypothetical protein
LKGFVAYPKLGDVIDRALMDLLTYRNIPLAQVWKDRVRASSQLRHYHALDDDTLVEMNADLYPVLARWFNKGKDTNALGAYFVNFGKARQSQGFPVSEVLYSLVLAEKVVVEGMMSEGSLESSIQMYQAVDATMRISEFFLLGSFYLTKGFLEETYMHLNTTESVPEELLKRYFRDDFFFK